jgi:signal transduction protein with GAF and PtsI domain
VREALPDVPAYVTDALHAGLALDPSRRPPSAAAFAQLLGAAPAPERGRSLAASVGSPRRPAAVLEAVARAAAGIFDAAAASIALERPDGGLRFEAAWGAGADEIVGVELEAGAGIVGSVALGGRPLAIADCRADPRFASAVAAGTGYVPHTLLAVPLRLGERVIGVLELLDRRDGEPYRDADAAGAQHLATIAAAALGEAASQTPTVAG